MIRWSFLILVFSLLLIACNKEEVFNPNKKIQYVLLQGTSSMDTSMAFIYENGSISEILYKQLGKDFSISLNKNGTIDKITSNVNDEYILLTYDGTYLNNMEFYQGNQLTKKIQVGRKDKNNKINRLSYYLMENKQSKSVFDNVFFPSSDQLIVTKENLHKSTSTLVMVRNITYENDNISREKVIDYDGQDSTIRYSASFTYDDKKNPFYGLAYPIMDLSGYSKNNILTAYYTYDNGYERYDRAYFSQKHDYEYKNKYPSSHNMVEYGTYSDKVSIYDENTQTYHDSICVRYEGITDKVVEYFYYCK